MSSAATLNQSSPSSLSEVITSLSNRASSAAFINTPPFSTFNMASAPSLSTGAFNQLPLSSLSTGALGDLSTGATGGMDSTGATGGMDSTGATGAAMTAIDINLINETLNGVVQRLGLIQRIIPGITDADLMNYMAQSNTTTQGTGTDEVLNDTPLNDTPLNDTPLNDTPLNDTQSENTASENTPSENTSSENTPSENSGQTAENYGENTPSENNMGGGGRKRKPKRKTRRRNKRGLNSTR